MPRLMTDWKKTALVLPLCLALAGCGGPGGKGMSDSDRKNLVRPPEAQEGYGLEAEVTRTWAPAAEAMYQRVRSSKLGAHRLLAVSFGMSGDYLYDGVALFWSDEGPFRVVRLGAEFGHLDDPTWEVAEVSRERGEELVQEVGERAPFAMASDMSLTSSVFGEGGAVLFFEWGGQHHEAQVWAPFALSQRGGDPGASEILMLVRELAGEAF